MMPVMDGYELVRRLRESDNHIPVMMITAKDAFDDMRRGFISGTDDYMIKPVTVNGKTYRFLNGIGYGIDGYCYEVGDKLRETTEGNINYTAIAIKGLLFHYKPTDATVTVDGVKHKFKRVWLAPTMNGKFYGGGMMPSPNQDRTGGKLSVMVYHNLGKLKALMLFPSIFKGEHVKQKNIAILEGREITVEFDRPTPLQIDGETILGISSYKTKAHYHDMVNA